MAVTLGQLGTALRITTDINTPPEEPVATELRRFLAVAVAYVDRYASTAPADVKDQAAISFCGYLFDQPSSPNGLAYANAFVSSGAQSMLSPWWIAPSFSGEAAATAGTNVDPIVRATISGRVVTFFTVNGTEIPLELPAGGLTADEREVIEGAVQLQSIRLSDRDFVFADDGGDDEATERSITTPGISVRIPSGQLGTAWTVNELEFAGTGVAAVRNANRVTLTVTAGTGGAGTPGPQGPVGPAGPTGPKGDKGDKGDPGTSSGALTVQDEGSTLGTTSSVDTINFAGSAVTATRSGNTVTITITGGSGGGLNTQDVINLIAGNAAIRELEEFEQALRHRIAIILSHSINVAISNAAYRFGTAAPIVPSQTGDVEIIAKVGTNLEHRFDLADLLAKPTVIQSTQLSDANSVSWTQGDDTFRIARETGTGQFLFSCDEDDTFIVSLWQEVIRIPKTALPLNQQLPAPSTTERYLRWNEAGTAVENADAVEKLPRKLSDFEATIEDNVGWLTVTLPHSINVYTTKPNATTLEADLQAGRFGVGIKRNSGPNASPGYVVIVNNLAANASFLDTGLTLTEAINEGLLRVLQQQGGDVYTSQQVLSGGISALNTNGSWAHVKGRLNNFYVVQVANLGASVTWEYQEFHEFDIDRLKVNTGVPRNESGSNGQVLRLVDGRPAWSNVLHGLEQVHTGSVSGLSIVNFNQNLIGNATRVGAASGFRVSSTTNSTGLFNWAATLTVTTSSDGTIGFTSASPGDASATVTRITGDFFASEILAATTYLSATAGRGVNLRSVRVYFGTTYAGQIILRAGNDASGNLGLWVEYITQSASASSGNCSISVAADLDFLPTEGGGTGGGTGGIATQDEGSTLGTGNVGTLDFRGAGVTATRSADKTTVTVPGGVVVEDNGAKTGTGRVDTIDFRGTAVDVTYSGTEAAVAFTSGLTIQGPTGIQIGNQRASVLRFRGFILTDRGAGAVQVESSTGAGRKIATATFAQRTATTTGVFLTPTWSVESTFSGAAADKYQGTGGNLFVPRSLPQTQAGFFVNVYVGSASVSRFFMPWSPVVISSSSEASGTSGTTIMKVGVPSAATGQAVNMNLQRQVVNTHKDAIFFYSAGAHPAFRIEFYEWRA